MPEIVLISVLLPAPLSPTSAVTWPTGNVQVDVGEGAHRAEVLAHPDQAQQRLVAVAARGGGSLGEGRLGPPGGDLGVHGRGLGLGRGLLSLDGGGFGGRLAGDAGTAGLGPGAAPGPRGPAEAGRTQEPAPGPRWRAGRRPRSGWSPGAPPYVQPEAAHYDIPAVLHRATYWPTHSCATVTNLSAMTVEAMFVVVTHVGVEQHRRHRDVGLGVLRRAVHQAGRRGLPGPDVHGQRRGGLRLQVDRLVDGAALVAGQDVLQARSAVASWPVTGKVLALTPLVCR